MIETTTTTNKQTNPKIICSAVHLSKKIVQKDTNILLQKKIKEKDACASLENRLCLFSRSLQNFLEKECDMRISRCVMPVGKIKLSPIDLSLLAVMQKSYAHVRK